MEEITFYHITYTHMKKLILLLALLISSCDIFAQQPELTDKVASIEAKVAMLETVVNAMQQKVDEVTAQNLALKQAISLQPTIAEFKTEDGIDYRLIEAKGSRQTGDIKMIISVRNTTKRDIRLQFEASADAVDIDGKSYNKFETFEKSQIANNHFSGITNLMPDTPVELVVIFPAETEPSYIKSFDLNAYNNHGFRFTNIPIKWE